MRIFYTLLLILFFIGCHSKPELVKDKAVENPDSTFWHHRPMRILQTVLRQPDGADYNVDSLIRYMDKVHANVLVINGGGIVDYFQNMLPMANINPYIGSRDLLKDIVKGCHDAGINVIARVDFRGVEKERWQSHPDWFARDEDGEPIILNYTTPGLYAPCYNGYYRNEHAVDFISQLFEKYEIDGIWHNSVNFHYTCYCDRCQKLFDEAYHKKIPTKTSTVSEWETYYLWNEKMAGNQLSKMRQIVKKYGEDKSYAAEVFDMYSVEQQKHTGINLYSAAEYFDFLVIVSFIADNRFPVEYKDIYYPSAIVRFLKSLEPDKPPVILFGGNGTEHRYIYDPPLDSRLWLWEAAATGGGFWNCYFNGTYPANTLDRRNAYLAKDAYHYIEKNEALIHEIKPVTDVGIFYSKSTAMMLGDADFSEPLKGALRMVEEAHYQYGFVSDRNLTLDRLNQFKVIIMPNVAALSDEDAGIIRSWVNQGGKLIATFQTSLFDAYGKNRIDFALSDVFGVGYDGSEINTAMDCYQKIITRNSVLAGFEQTQLLHNSGKTLMVTPTPESIVVTGYLPKINNQPPEYAYPENWDSHHPIIVIHNFGDGKTIYFANEAARLNYTIGHPDYNDLLVNSINTLLDTHNVLKTNAPASVHVYLNQSKTDSNVYQLSLVNTTSGSLRPMRDLVPVSGIHVKLPFEIKAFEPLSNKNGAIRIEGNNVFIDHMDEFISIKLNKDIAR